MPIYEYRCSGCEQIFERLELSIQEIPTSQCPLCMGVGIKLISRPSIVYSVFDEKAIHKLPDWEHKKRAAQVHDTKVRKHLRSLPPMPSDKGQDIKVYETDFGSTERRKLEQKAQLDNMP